MDKPSDSPSDLGQSRCEHRAVSRYNFIAVAEIIESSTKTRVTGRIAEISRKGAYVDTLNPLPVGTSLSLVISRDKGSFVTKGKVIYVHPGIGMGVAFLDLADDQLKMLDSWMSEFPPEAAL